jgi:GNAT superfamily N-acetyltransferase
MDIRLRPLRNEELDEFIEASRFDYIEGLIAHARMSEEFARDKAGHDLAAYVDVGVIPDGHGLYWIEEDGERVGRLWFEERASVRVGRLVWLYEIEIEKRFRSRGYGRRALELLEDEVGRRGIGEIALNVWGGNEAARSLYRSQGYFERAVEMAKDLA